MASSFPDFRLLEIDKTRQLTCALGIIHQARLSPRHVLLLPILDDRSLNPRRGSLTFQQDRHKVWHGDIIWVGSCFVGWMLKEMAGWSARRCIVIVGQYAWEGISTD
jgi:hypothetical protein